jgi:LAGLIDADG DNA endonuclease family protein
VSVTDNNSGRTWIGSSESYLTLSERHRGRVGGVTTFGQVTHPELSGLRQAFYSQNAVKGVPIDLMDREMTAFGLAIWFMDDGTADRNQVRINTQSFSRDENLMLIKFLHAKLGLTATLNKDKDRHRLRIGANDMTRFIDLVAPFIIPSMQYKLPL